MWKALWRHGLDEAGYTAFGKLLLFGKGEAMSDVKTP
jgi:hypothetical protein